MPEATAETVSMRLPTEPLSLGAILTLYGSDLPDQCRTIYPMLIDNIRAAGTKLGYAIAVHGSLARDIDLVAIPWTEDAVSAAELVQAIRQAVETASPTKMAILKPAKPVQAVHGRLAWSIELGDGLPYIDFSVMPTSSFGANLGGSSETAAGLRPAVGRHQTKGAEKMMCDRCGWTEDEVRNAHIDGKCNAQIVGAWRHTTDGNNFCPSCVAKYDDPAPPNPDPNFNPLDLWQKQ